eukprot:6341643-Prymnesium_polylepis.1
MTVPAPQQMWSGNGHPARTRVRPPWPEWGVFGRHTHKMHKASKRARSNDCTVVERGLLALAGPGQVLLGSRWALRARCLSRWAPRENVRARAGLCERTKATLGYRAELLEKESSEVNVTDTDEEVERLVVVAGVAVVVLRVEPLQQLGLLGERGNRGRGGYPGIDMFSASLSH